MTEAQTPSAVEAGARVSLKDKLEKLLSKPWDEIVVDVGCGGYVSTVAEKGTLLILVDPQMELDAKKLNWGDNYREKGSALLLVQGGVKSIAKCLEGKVDRVQMIAPDPDDFWGMFTDSRDMPKKHGGELVVVFDSTSNKRQRVSSTLKFIKGSEFIGFRRRIYQPGEIDAGEIVGGTVNSHFVSDSAPVAIFTRK